MQPCLDAIEALTREVDVFGQGTPFQPKPNTAHWFTLRAKSLALAYLRQLMQTNACNSPETATELYKLGLRGVKVLKPEELKEFRQTSLPLDSPAVAEVALEVAVETEEKR